MTHRLCDSACGRLESWMSSALCLTLLGMRLSWSAWKPAQVSSASCALVNLRRFFATFSEGDGAALAWDLSAPWVCWQMGLCAGQWFF